MMIGIAVTQKGDPMRLIDADALKEYIHNQDGRPFIGITIGEAFQMMVDEQPTIEERKKGKWEEIYDANENGEPYPCGAACSECGFPTNIETDYCPNCGSYNGGEE